MSDRFELSKPIPITVAVEKTITKGFALRISDDVSELMKLKDGDVLVVHLQKVLEVD